MGSEVLGAVLSWEKPSMATMKIARRTRKVWNLTKIDLTQENNGFDYLMRRLYDRRFWSVPMGKSIDFPFEGLALGFRRTGVAIPKMFLPPRKNDRRIGQTFVPSHLAKSLR